MADKKKDKPKGKGNDEPAKAARAESAPSVVEPPAPKGPPPRHVFRWDLDKTYLETDFDSLRGLFRSAFEKAESKHAVPGAAALLRELRTIEGARVSFISGSPSQMRKVLAKKLALDGVEVDEFVLKQNLRNLLKGRFRALREQVGYKLPALLAGRANGCVLATRETCFGDDAEADGFVYSLYADLLAGRADRALVEEVLRRGRVYPDDAERTLALVDRVAPPAPADAKAADAKSADAKTAVAKSAVAKSRDAKSADTKSGDAKGADAKAADASGERPQSDGGPVGRIFIRLDRHSPTARFDRYGARLVPVYNYLQAGLVLLEDGLLDEARLVRVCAEMLARFEYAPLALRNSIEDLLRRGRASEATVHRFAAALETPEAAALEPSLPPLGAKLAALRALPGVELPPTVVTPVDYLDAFDQDARARSDKKRPGAAEREED